MYTITRWLIYYRLPTRFTQLPDAPDRSVRGPRTARLGSARRGAARRGAAGESIDFTSHEQRRGCTLERLYSLSLWKHRADRERTLLYVMYIIAGQIKSPRATDKHARVLHATVVLVILAVVVVVYRQRCAVYRDRRGDWCGVAGLYTMSSYRFA